MKFGKNLSRNQVPEWSHSYIKYSALKKLISKMVDDEKQGPTADTAEFFYSLDRNLEDVDTFYNKKYADACRRLKLLYDQYGKTLDNPNELDGNEVEDLIEGLLELRGSLRKLQWYGEVNRRGFVKITKKLDKKVPSHRIRKYVESRVDQKAFASDVGSGSLINQINEWLSKASEARKPSKVGSEPTAQTLPRVSAKAVLEISRLQLDRIDQCVRADQVAEMQKLLDEALQDSTDPAKNLLYQRLLSTLLQRAITCRSENCIVKLLDHIDNLDEGDDFNQRNCLHRFVLSLNRAREADSPSLHPVTDLLNEENYVTPATAPLLSIPSRSMKESSPEKNEGRSVQALALLNFILNNLSEAQRPALISRDNSDRTPLHYAAQYGLVVVVQIIIARMQQWGQYRSSDGVDAPFWKDSDGMSPTHLSVIGNHYNTTKALIQADGSPETGEFPTLEKQHLEALSEVLSLATERDATNIVKFLVDVGVNVNYQDDQGECALHIAARHGDVECVQALLSHSSSTQIKIDIAEKTFGWTPLFIACVDGHIGVVELLLDAGANPQTLDNSGWTAAEHACLRGHIKVAELVNSHFPKIDASSAPLSPATLAHGSLSGRNSQATANGQPKTTVPVKSFGHRYLQNESMVLVSLGSSDMRKLVDVVSLDRIPLAAAHETQLDTALSIVVSATGASGEPIILDLPIQDSVNTEPIEFTTKDPTKVKILFDIVPRYAGSKDKVVGRGVALLGTVKPNLGSNRMALQGDLSVPIVASHNLEVIGCVNFNFIVVNPFRHKNISISEGQTYWKSMAEPVVIGHRGLGKNTAARTSLQLGENTIQSFITAANLGAQYVEFDVQLTKDHVPVIYHDFLVSETGIDAPVHLLTLEQFMHVSEGRTPRDSRQGSPTLQGVDKVKPVERKGRSLSVGRKGTSKDEMDERMKHTRDFKAKGFKGNSRSFIQAPFTTLEEMFQKIPEHVGFNIEVKYPMLHESEEQEMDTYAVELNYFVDTVLKKVFDLNGKRNILMSSFNPDICLLLSLKQPSIPILFLTDAGVEPVGDIRASSLQEAIRFASRWNLLGIVSAADPLCLSPRLVHVVKESGLMCVSYGSLNNDSNMVKLQVQNGIDAVIVDSVLAIRKGLTGIEDAKAVTSPSSEPVAGSVPTTGLESPLVLPQRPATSGIAEIPVS